MIPNFPKFKKLELSDRADIEEITKQFPPYSDFNFTSMWSWDIDGTLLLAKLNDNMVINLPNYLTGKPQYTFIGKNNLKDTIKRLLFLQKESAKPQLFCVPGEFVLNIDKNLYTVEKDIDNFDYILSTQSLLSYSGKKLGPKRNFVNRFRKRYKTEILRLDIRKQDVQSMLDRVFVNWLKIKGMQDQNHREYLAFTKMLNNAIDFDLFVVGIFLNDQLIGFTINEIINDEFAVLHFEKADYKTYIGIYPFLKQETARLLSSCGCKYINYCQDMGVHNLRIAKSRYDPTFLQKFTISLQQDSTLSTSTPLRQKGNGV